MIAEENSGESRPKLERWEPEKQVRRVYVEEARLSRGLFAADPVVWFSQLGDHWKALFHSLGLEVAFEGTRKSLELPADLVNLSRCEFDGEAAVMGYATDSAAIVAEAVVPGLAPEIQPVIIEYISRRLLATLAKSWGGPETLSCNFAGEFQSDFPEISAAIGLDLQVSSEPCSIWFGLGPRAAGKLDRAWKMLLIESNISPGENVHSDHVYRVSVELAELAVPPAMLIDYMRSGMIIDLEVPVSDHVRILVDDELWAEGELCQFKGTAAVQITDTQPTPQVFPESTTRVRVEIAQTELDRESLLEQGQRGAILVCDGPLSNSASLIISGENVASALVGTINGQFAIKILPK